MDDRFLITTEESPQYERESVSTPVPAHSAWPYWISEQSPSIGGITDTLSKNCVWIALGVVVLLFMMNQKSGRKA